MKSEYSYPADSGGWQGQSIHHFLLKPGDCLIFLTEREEHPGVLLCPFKSLNQIKLAVITGHHPETQMGGGRDTGSRRSAPDDQHGIRSVCSKNPETASGVLLISLSSG